MHPRTQSLRSTTLSLVLCALALGSCANDAPAGGESNDDGGTRRADVGGSGAMDGSRTEHDAGSIADGSGGGPEAGAPDAAVAPFDAGSGPGDDLDAGSGPADDLDAGGVPGTDLVWRLANLTNFESYPDPGSEECIEFSGCDYVGQFAFVDGTQSEEWVMMHNIVAVHSDDGDTYALKTLRLRQDGREIDVTVYDVCADSDCDGCCTENSRETGFLIDIERYTMERFGSGDGIVEWACLDCD